LVPAAIAAPSNVDGFSVVFARDLALADGDVVLTASCV
jgi:hypothetical protein